MKTSTDKWWKGALIAAVILRLFFASFFFHPDIKSQHFHAQYFKRGVVDIYGFIAANREKLPYRDTFNYPPLAYYTLGVWNAVSGVVLGGGLSEWLNDWGVNGYRSPRMFEFMLVLKIPYMLADFAILALLLSLTSSLSSRKTLTILWLFNPLSLFAVYMIGQFDIMVTLLTVAAFVLAGKNKLLWSAFLLGLGAALKSYPLLLLPFVVMRARRPEQFFSAILTGVVGLFLPMITVISSSDFFTTMSQSNLMQRIFGATLPIDPNMSIPFYLFAYSLIIWLSWARRTESGLLPEFLSVTLLVPMLADFHAQWVIWSLPFLVLYLTRNFRKHWLLFAGLISGILVTVWLTADQWAFLGLFSALNRLVLMFPPLPEIVKSVYDPIFLRSVFHSMLLGTGIWVLLDIWRQKYET